MDIAFESVILAQNPRDPRHICHGLIGRADDPGRQEQPLDVVSPVEFQGQRHDLLDREARALDIRRYPIDAIGAVEDAEIGHQDLEQADAATVWRVGVANASPTGRPDATRAGIALFTSR